MPETSPRSRVAVVGVGRMGRHHARTAAKLAHADLLAVVDGQAERAATVADEYGCAAFATVDELLAAHGDSLHAAVIAVPTRFHADAARPFLERGIACLIEKPLAANVAEAKQIADLAEQHHAVLQVGHTERFNPAVRAVAELQLVPRFMEVDRVSPMTFRSLDVGVVMDMMIHDLDIVLSFARSPIKTVDATGIAVLGEHEDIANARIVFESGCVATLTASRVALKTARTLRFFSEKAYVSLNYANRSGVIVRRSDNIEALERVRQQIAEGKDLTDTDYHELIHLDDLSMDLPDGQDDPLTAQLINFLDAARLGDAPTVTAKDGYEAIAAAERVIEKINAHQWEGLEDPLFAKRK
ncbi:MAG: Gfo/Idh/MocA family oxidoreductase [Planctomycetes bacterium]|jgi:predicted dehydrogenase|nr:Gfo/Idh/MocA family oxidoreductase [Planctomycetota bacterium]